MLVQINEKNHIFFNHEDKNIFLEYVFHSFKKPNNKLDFVKICVCFEMAVNTRWYSYEIDH